MIWDRLNVIEKKEAVKKITLASPFSFRKAQLGDGKCLPEVQKNTSLNTLVMNDDIHVGEEC